MGYYEGTHHQKYCIKKVVREIVKAQNQVARDDQKNGCDVSCDQSIKQLLSPSRPRRKSRYTTIPFVLYSKGSLKPFVGSGFSSTNSYFECVESPVFRAKKFVDHDCVILELLLPVQGNRPPSTCNCGHCSYCRERERAKEELMIEEDVGLEKDFNHEISPSKGHKPSHKGCHHFLCQFFKGERFKNFKTTGVCITVDLNCFCAISCLKPIRPVRG